ncbi:MAG: hypothetical protein CSB44_11385 [Gammaproteobacteria bacterium]|nr:MAG: hypothetical protein CSB44_11385 [Gammaproteobacteria bacterium]
MTIQDIGNAAAELSKARHRNTLLDTAFVPADIDEAYALQDAITRLQPKAPAGWKLGATSTAALELLALEEPFFGPLFDTWHHVTEGDGFILPTSTLPVAVETEVVLFFKDDVRASDGEDDATLEARIRAAIAAAAPGFEIVGTRYDRGEHPEGLPLVADFGGNVATVVGKPVRFEADTVHPAHGVSLSINDKPAITGHCDMNLTGNLMAMVMWFLRHERFQARGLRAGEFLFTGTCTGITPLAVGDTACADLGSLGSIRIELAG